MDFNITLRFILVPVISMLFLLKVDAQEPKKLKIAKSEIAQEYKQGIEKLDLSSQQTAQALKWSIAKNFVLNSEGNFVPYFPGKNTSQDGNPQRLSATGGNCAKIKCPEVFDPDMVCWECH